MMTLTNYTFYNILSAIISNRRVFIINRVDCQKTIFPLEKSRTRRDFLKFLQKIVGNVYLRLYAIL